MIRVVLGLVIAGSVLGAGFAPSQGGRQDDPEDARREALRWAADFDGHRAVTRPSRDAVIGFTIPTAVREVSVRGGQTVTVGDLLIRGDDEEDRAEAVFSRMRAETPLPLERAKAEEELAQLEYDKALDANRQGAGAPQELERARVRHETAVIDRQLAELNQTLSATQADKAEARVEKFSLKAPFDGTVDLVMVDVGQSVGAGDPVVRVVNIDKLWIDVPVPTDQTIALGTKKDDPAWVLMPLAGKPSVFEGTVIEVSPTADSQSGTRRVRVEVQNPTRIVPGLNCWVRFTTPSQEWQGRISRATASPTVVAAAGESTRD